MIEDPWPVVDRIETSTNELSTCPSLIKSAGQWVTIKVAKERTNSVGNARNPLLVSDPMSGTISVCPVLQARLWWKN